MSRLEPFGPTVLRIALGIVFLAHSAYLKVVVYTMPGTAGYFESIGLLGFAAYAVMLLEVIGGAMLILGVRVRETAAVLAVVALGATWAHSGAGWLFSNEGGGYEYPLFLAAACIAQALMGSGAGRVTELTGAADASV